MALLVLPGGREGAGELNFGVPSLGKASASCTLASPRYEVSVVFSGTHPMGSITGVEPGVTVQIVMQAVNESSQGVASEPVLFTMPEAAKPEVPATDAGLAP